MDGNNGTNTQSGPVITEMVENTSNGVETTRFEDGVRVSLRIDYTEASNLYAASLVRYYDATGRETGYDETHRDGTTYEERTSARDGENAITRSVVRTDPLNNVEPWTKLSYVERYLDDSNGNNYFHNRLSSSYHDVYDDGSASFADYLFDANDFHYPILVSSGFIEAITGISTTFEYDLGQKVSETLLDLKGTQDYTSIVKTFAGGNVVTQKQVNDNGLTVTTDFTDGVATTKTTVDHGSVRAWASHVLTLDAGGKPVTGMTINDDGSTAATTYTNGIRTKAVIDLDGANGDVGSVLTYGATGVLERIVKTTADELVTTTKYVNGALTAKSVLDSGDAFIWNKHIVAYDAQGHKTSSVTTYDQGGSIATDFTNGIRSRQVIDRAEASGGLDSVRAFDATGALSGTEWTTAKGVVVTTTYAGGKAYVRTALDLADAFEFNTHTQSYQDGKVSSAVTSFDGGLVRTVAYVSGVMTERTFVDGGDDFGWQSYQYALDEKGAAIGSHTVWDNLAVTDTGSFI